MNRRRVSMFLGLGALMALGVWLVRSQGLDAESISAWLRARGAWSGPLYVVAFIVGELAYLPGVAFIIAARVVFGPALGFVLAYFGALLAVTVPFLLVRVLRRGSGRAFNPRWSRLKKLFDDVEVHPIKSVLILRLFLWLSPPLNYALALTGIRTRDYVIGSALGLLPCVTIVLSSLSCLGLS